MKLTKTSIKTMTVVLILALIAGCIPLNSMSTVQAADPDILNESMEYLVNDCGPRLTATPNEDKAADYINSKFTSYGYDVQHDKITHTTTSYTGRIEFAGDIQDSYGNAYPNNVASFGAITGDITEFGTFGNITIPENAGDIVGTVKVTSTLAGDVGNQINSIYASAAAVTGTSLKGLVFTRDDSIGTVKQRAQTPSMTGGKATSYAIGLTDRAYKKVLTEADSVNKMEVIARSVYNNVVATKPAKSGNPDTILIVSSHMDSVMNSPGASDNGSGVAATLELARRYADVDMGNVELRFAVWGYEEGGLRGSRYYVSKMTEAEKAITVNMNMDMLCADTQTSDGRDLNAVSMDTYQLPQRGLNWAGHAVVSQADKTQWADGIDNVRVYSYGSSDHVSFTEAGMEAASMIVATDEDDDIEYINHTALDNLEDNYSYDRLLMCTNLIDNGIKLIKDTKLTKKIDFSTRDMNTYSKLSLNDPDLYFKGQGYSKITVNAIPQFETTYKAISMTPGKTYANGMPLHGLDVKSVIASFEGVADFKNKERNELYKAATAKLAHTVAETYQYDVAVSAEKGGIATGGNERLDIDTDVTVKATPASGYRFVGWYDKATDKLVSSDYKYTFKVAADTKLVAKFAPISKTSIKVKAGKKKAKITWKADPNAFQYQIYRATKKNGTYKKLKTLDATKTSYTNKKLKKGKKYYYKVRVVCKTDVYTYGPFSSVKGVKIKK